MINEVKANKTKIRRLCLLFILVVVFVGVLISGLINQSVPSEQVSTVQAFPTFSIQSLLQPEQKLDLSVFSAPYQLVNVWASWCGICKGENAFLLSLQKQGVPIIGLNYRDSVGSATQYLAHLGNPYQHVIYDANGALALDIGVIGTPETYLVNSQGSIIKKFSGELTDSVWQASFSDYFIHSEQ
ncbi:MAG: DsbE family thiol:disulfide interchange protein [Vibrio sp.]|uniref:DsbE family thiol:disulfide interchange protein n=1 Tax=Vibrio sp. TaxID=678 RepID=UPI003A85B2C2